MPLSQKVVVVLEVRSSKKIDAELTKSKSKIKGWAATVSREMKNVFKRATFFRFSTIGINSFFNSIRFAREEATQFQSALAGIVKVDLERYVSLNSQATKQLSQTIYELSQRYGVLRVEAAKALEVITVAGLRGADATKALDIALLGQAATGLNAAQVFSAILLPAMKQFGAGVNDLESVLDILVTTQANAAIGFAEFAGAFRAGGATLAKSTSSLNEAAALIAALGDITQESGATLGTFFKTIAPRLLANPRTQKVLQRFKVKIEEQGAVKSNIKIFTDLARAIKSAGSAARAKALSEIAGIRQGNRLIALLDSLAKAEELMAKNTKAAGDTRRRVAVEQQTIAAKWRKVQNEFAKDMESAVLPVMDTFISALRGLIPDFTAAAIGVVRLGQALGLINKLDTKESAQFNVVSDLRAQSKRLSEEGLKAVNKDIAKMAYQFSSDSLDAFREAFRGKHGLDPGVILGKFFKSITFNDNYKPDKRAFANIDDIIGFYDYMVSHGVEFGMEHVDKIDYLQKVRQKIIQQIQADKKEGRGPRTSSLLSTGIEKQTGSMVRSVLDKFTEELRGGAAANGIEQFRTRIATAMEAINKPAASFNRGILQTRKGMVELNKVRKKARDDALKAARDQAAEDLKGLKGAARLTLERELQQVAEKKLASDVKDQAKLAEFDAKAMRRLNTELSSMKDKGKNAASKLTTTTRRLNELRIEEAKAASAVARSTIELKEALIEYGIGLIRSKLEAKKVTGEVGSLAQELAGAKKIIPLFLTGLNQKLRSAPRVAGGFGGDDIINNELKLSNLRRESLREQLNLTLQILERQREIGASFFNLDSGGRNSLVQGLGAIQNLFGRFGGDVNAFRSLSSQDLNAFGRQLLSLPDEVKESILKATEFIPEGATVAGFSGKQIRDLIAAASLGRAGGTGILDIADLQQEAADSTTKLAELQTDSIATAIEQLNVAQKQLDQQRAQTETAKIQVELARQQLGILSSEQSTRRIGIAAEMEYIRRQNRPKGPAMGTNAVLGYGTLDRFNAFVKSLDSILTSAREGGFSEEAIKRTSDRFDTLKASIVASDTAIAELDNTLLRVGRTVSTLNGFLEKSDAADIAKVGRGTPGFVIAGGKTAGTTTQEETNKNLLQLIELLRPYLETTGMSFNAEGLGAMIKKMEEVITKYGGKVPTEVLLKIAGETIEKVEIVGLSELPYAMAQVVANHPDVKDARSLRTHIGEILQAMITAGIEAGAFPPTMQSQVGLLRLQERTD